MLSKYHSYYQFLKHTSRPLINSTQLTTTPGPKPVMRTLKCTAGKTKSLKEKIVPSATHENPQQIQSDTSGFHSVAVIQGCREPQCHKRLCDTTHRDICPHQTGSGALSAELAGALTHKIPSDKNGVLLDSHDANGKPSPQYLVKENTAVPIDMKDFKQNEKMAEYVQQEPIVTIIRSNIPDNSIISLKNTSINDTPYDENF